MKYNESNKGLNTTTNHEGSKAYKLNSPEMELYTIVCTASLQDKFYEKEKQTLERIKKLIHMCDAEFVAKLAVYAREQMYLRSIPIVLAVELSKFHSKDSLVSKLVHRIIQRADEITELLAYYQFSNNRKDTKKLNKLSKQIQKGVASSFNKFDEYQFAKYNRSTSVKLRDALFLSHAKPLDDAQKVLFKKIADDTLDIPITWETQLSEAGKTGKSKSLVWEELIQSNKIGYMALLRNLRNILDSGISKEVLAKVCTKLSSKEEVMKSKQLPFRFLSAYLELKDNSSPYTSTILSALEEAIQHSSNNIQGYDYDTTVMIASDVSGSMEKTISPKSKVQLYDVGLTLSMLLQNRCKSVITGIFGNIYATIQLPKNNILCNVAELHRIEGKVGYSTNGHEVLRYLIDNKIIVDKVVMFTDCQMWNSNNNWIIRSNSLMPQYWSKYKQLAPNAKLYLFDLAGHGSTPVMINGNDTYLIAGWSDKVFDVLKALDEGQTVLSKINDILL